MKGLLIPGAGGGSSINHQYLEGSQSHCVSRSPLLLSFISSRSEYSSFVISCCYILLVLFVTFVCYRFCYYPVKLRGIPFLSCHV